MPVKVDTVEILKKYFSGVVKRANHHAPNVDDIIYTLLGIIILKKDDNTSLEVRGSDANSTGNILQVFINGTKYAFRYEHTDGTVEIRRDNSNGQLVIKIDNTTSTATILAVF